MFWYGTSKFIKYDKKKKYKVYDNLRINKYRIYEENSSLFVNGSLTDLSLSKRTISNPDSIMLVSRADTVDPNDYYLDFSAGKRLLPSGVFNFSGDFAIELYCYFVNTTQTYNTLYEIGLYNAGILLRPNSGNIELWINNTQYIHSINWVNKWYSILLQRKSGAITLYIDGVAAINVTRLDSMLNLVACFGSSRHATGQNFRGYISTIAVFEGSAPYDSGDFTGIISATFRSIQEKEVLYGLKKKSVITSYSNYGTDREATPLDVDGLSQSNIAVWLDSYDASSLEFLNGKVKKWKDLSGNENHFYQDNTDRMVAYGAYKLNGRDLLSFNGNFVGLISNLNLLAPYSIMVVSRNRNGGRVLQSLERNALICPYRGSNAFYNEGDIRSSGIVAADVWNICTVVVSGTAASQIWYKGNNMAAGASHGNWSTVVLGGPGRYNESPDGEILGVVITKKVLSVAEIVELEGILAWRYSLVNELLYSGHKYQFDKPMVGTRKMALEQDYLLSGEKFLSSSAEDIFCDEDGNTLIH